MWRSLVALSWDLKSYVALSWDCRVMLGLTGYVGIADYSYSHQSMCECKIFCVFMCTILGY